MERRKNSNSVFLLRIFILFSFLNFIVSLSCRNDYNHCVIRDWDSEKDDYPFNNRRNYLTNLTLILKANQEELPSDLFSKLYNLQNLNASHNQLTKIDRESFQSANNLENLDLSNNRISSISNMAFFYLKKLNNLNLSSNKISTLKSATFEECGKTLLFLNLSHNLLSEISEDVLDPLTNKFISIDLSHNKIAIIKSESSSDSSDRSRLRSFNELKLDHNLLEKFEFEFESITDLDLSNNRLQDVLLLKNKTVFYLDVSNNNLSELKVDGIMELKYLFISNNYEMKKLLIGSYSNLNTVGMRNVNLQNISGINLLRNSSKMIFLDLSYSYVGPLNVDDFSEMTSLKTLFLKATGISRITYGTFSHQKELELLDISDNNLGFIDLQMFSGMKKLKTLDISGNNLTKLDLYESLKSKLPSLEKVKLDNPWTCSYLGKVFESMSAQGIIVEPVNVVKNSSNIFGIGCQAGDQKSIIKLNSDVDDKVSTKLNELIDEMNKIKINVNNFKVDVDVLKSEIFNLRNKIIDNRSNIANLQLQSASISNKTSDDKIKEIQALVENMKNITLEKQQITTDKLTLQMNELHLELAKMKHEHDKNTQISSINKERTEMLQTQAQIPVEQYSDTQFFKNFVIVLMTAIITSIIIIGIVKTKAYFRKYIRENMSVRYRNSESTLTTALNS